MCSSKWAPIIFEANFTCICTFWGKFRQIIASLSFVFLYSRIWVGFKLPSWEAWGFWGAAGRRAGVRGELPWAGSRGRVGGSFRSSAKQLYLELYILNDSEGTHLKGVMCEIGILLLWRKKKRPKPWDVQVTELTVTNLDWAYKGFLCIDAELSSQIIIEEMETQQR